MKFSKSTRCRSYQLRPLTLFLSLSLLCLPDCQDDDCGCGDFRRVLAAVSSVFSHRSSFPRHHGLRLRSTHLSSYLLSRDVELDVQSHYLLLDE